MSAPIASNLVFPPSMMDRTFSQRATYGISTFKDLYIDEVFAFFKQLSDKVSMPQNNFFPVFAGSQFYL